MPSTAKFLSAHGKAIHAHRPGVDSTLCGLEVIDPEFYMDSDEPVPPRSADFTGYRFYNGVSRLMCERCCTEVLKDRLKAEFISVPLETARTLRQRHRVGHRRRPHAGHGGSSTKGASRESAVRR